MDPDDHTPNSGLKPGQEQLTMSKQDNILKDRCTKRYTQTNYGMSTAESGETQPTTLCSSCEAFMVALFPDSKYSIAKLLRNNGYEYEADHIITAITKYRKEKLTPKTEEVSNE